MSAAPDRSEQRAAGARRAWPRLLVVALLGGAACGPIGGNSSDGSPAEAAGNSVPAPATNAPAPALDGGAAAFNDPLAGGWWVFMPDRPFLAFRLLLEPADDDRAEGSWTSFDWRATRQPDDLRHRSKGVTVSCEIDDDELVISGPAPMLDANGQPNGHRGSWRLDLRTSNLPGEPRRYFGRAFSSEFKDAEGVAVSLERDYRPWKP